MKFRIENTGFTLIEVAIAMGVLAIGLLGLASLQAVSLKNSSSTLYRSQATNLANSIIDAMRANKSNVATNYTDNTQYNPVCVNSLNLIGSIAERDVMAWRNSLACVLPQGMGFITVNGNFVTVTVHWDNSRNQTQAEHSNEQDPVEKIEVRTIL